MPWNPARAKARSYIENRSIPEPSTGCWLWDGQVDKDGYGRFRERYPGPWIKAHRASFLCHKGQIPDGLGVLHTCNLRCCVNPDHLYAGTQKDNVRDMLVPLECRIAEALPAITPHKHDGSSISATARRLGISRRTLQQRVER